MRILFVHIPKTGGTALRRALFRARPDARNLCDYGPDSEATSQEVRTLRYGAGGSVERLCASLDEEPEVSLCGHVKTDEYAVRFRHAALVTVLRHPLSHVLSHYLHLHSQGRFAGSLLEFARLPKYRNLQSRLLGAGGLGRFAHVGCQERLADTADYLAALIGAPLELELANVGTGDARQDLGSDTRRELLRLNSLDAELYARALGGWRGAPDAGGAAATPPAC